MGCGLTQGLWDCHFVQVYHSITSAADKMHMGVCVSVEAFHAPDCGHTRCQTLFLEQVQVPVDGSYGKVGNVGLQLGVDGFGGGVRRRLPQAVENGIALAEMFGLRHVITSLNENNSYLQLKYIMPSFTCQHFFEKYF
jgi:hypothetical protein